MNGEPTWLLSGQTFIEPLAGRVCSPPMGRGTAGWTHEGCGAVAEPNPAARAKRERPGLSGISQLWWLPRDGGSHLPCHSCGQAARLDLSLWSQQTGYHSAPGPCFQSSVSRGESWSQRPQPGVGEEKEGQARPLGPAVALLSWGPALSRSQVGTERGSGVPVQRGGRQELQTVAAARTAWTAARPSAVTAVSPAGVPPPPSAW